MGADRLPEYLTSQGALTSRTVPVPSELHAACALAYDRARRMDNSAVPGPMRSFLHHPTLSPRALSVAYSAIESNASFRAFVSEGATSRQVGDAGMAWLLQDGQSAQQKAVTQSQLTAHQQLTALRDRHPASEGQPADPGEPLIRLAGPSQLRQRPLAPPPPAPAPSLDVIDALHHRITELEVQLESRTNAWREVLRQLSAANERLAQVEAVCSNIAS